MGKIRIKTLGIEELEKEQVKEAQKRKETKALRQAQGKQEKKLTKGAHGGERVVSMAPTEEELEKMSTDYSLQTKVKSDESETAVDGRPSTVVKKEKVFKKAHPVRSRSKRYRDALIQVDQNRLYSLSEAVELLKKLDATHFDGTVELHVNTLEKGISGQVTLPHGSGKTLRVAIADPSTDGQFDKLIESIEKGALEFDVLIAHPSAMPKLAKVAKILGPRGLMPNPKSGTISDTPTKLLEKFQGGQVNFRTESQAPIIHATIGKVSFKENALEENIQAFLTAVGSSKIRSVTLKSTMSPGIRLDLSTLS